MTCGGDASIRVAKPIGKRLPRQCVQCYKWCAPFYGMIRDYMRLNTAHYAIAPRAKLRHERSIADIPEYRMQYRGYSAEADEKTAVAAHSAERYSGLLDTINVADGGAQFAFIRNPMGLIDAGVYIEAEEK